MISGVSSFRTNSSNFRAVNYDAKNNYMNNSKQTAQIAFNGNLANVGTNLLEKTSLKLGGIFRKVLGKNELPFSKKPLTANATIKHILESGGIIDIPAPEMHTATTTILDGANLLVPDAADIAANTLNAASTKAALMETLMGTSHAFDVVTGGADALAAKAATIDAIATTIEHKSVIVDIIEGIGHVIDKLPL